MQRFVIHYHRPENSYSFKYFPHSLCSNITVWSIHHSLPHLINHCLSRVTFFTPIFRVQNVFQLTYTVLGLLQNLQPPNKCGFIVLFTSYAIVKVFVFVFFFLNKSLVLLYFYGNHHLTDFFFQKLFTILSLMTSLQICTHTFHIFKQLKFHLYQTTCSCSQFTIKNKMYLF